MPAIQGKSPSNARSTLRGKSACTSPHLVSFGAVAPTQRPVSFDIQGKAEGPLHLNPQISHTSGALLVLECRVPDRQNPAAPDMTKLTLGRAAKLYGLHRSTIYEAVAKGLVSIGVDGKGQKVIDLSEMIRRYGEPPSNPTVKPDTRQPAPVTYPTHQTDALQPLLEELRLLREEVRELRETLLLIEHKPTGHRMDAPPDNQELAEKPEKKDRPQSFADLLAGLD